MVPLDNACCRLPGTQETPEGGCHFEKSGHDRARLNTARFTVLHSLLECRALLHNFALCSVGTCRDPLSMNQPRSLSSRYPIASLLLSGCTLHNQPLGSATTAQNLARAILYCVLDPIWSPVPISGRAIHVSSGILSLNFKSRNDLVRIDIRQYSCLTV